MRAMKRIVPSLIATAVLLMGGAGFAAAASPGDEPPRPLAGRALDNVEALARLLGYVRFFHPSDGVAGMTPADWDALAMAGVQRVEGARNPRELAAALDDLFAEIAPGVVVFPLTPPGPPPGAPPTGGGLRWLAWKHRGIDLDSPQGGSYRSERVEIGRVPANASASVYQDLDVERLRGHRVRLSAALRRTAAAGSTANLTLLVYTFSGEGFQDWSQPIPAGGWGRVELDVAVPADAYYMYLSLDLYGEGKLTFDDVRATADGVDVTDHLLNPGFEEVVPGLPPRGWLLDAVPFAADYRLRPVSGGTAGRWAGELSGPHVQPLPLPLHKNLGGGVSVMVPLTLPADAQGTLPRGSQTPVHPVPDKPAGFVPTGNDRTTRLAGVVVGWNVFQHFYPYFDVVPADWPGALTRALTAAATNPDEAAYVRTLRRFLVELQDGHSRVEHPNVTLPVRFAFIWDRIEGQLVITSVEAGATHGMAVGDRVLQVDGRPVEAALAELESLIPGATPQWRKFVALRELAAGRPGGSATLTVQPRSGGPVRTVVVPYSVPTGGSIGMPGSGSPEEPRPDKIAEVRPGIFYVDLSRIDDFDFYDAVEDLAAADGVVFDLRGYPWFLSTVFLSHLIERPVTSDWFNIPIVTRPDRQDWTWRVIHWILPPEAPRLTGRIAFLVDGRAISYAESVMAIVEAEHLGVIVGGPTAGTNGNINPFPVAGGYVLRWTGMQVRKPDGSPHHGVGIRPNIPVERTLAGLLAGRDEVLERGIAAVSQP